MNRFIALFSYNQCKKIIKYTAPSCTTVYNNQQTTTTTSPTTTTSAPATSTGGTGTSYSY